MDLHLEALDDHELAELVGDGLARLHSRLHDVSYEASPEQKRLAELVLVFEHAGGRGVELADEIDELTAKIDADPRREMAKWIDRVCDAWDEGVDALTPAAGHTNTSA